MSKPEMPQKTGQKLIEGNEKQILEKIQKCQREVVEYRSKCDKDILEIEKKYIKAAEPHIQERNRLILSIPNFWSKILLHHPLLATFFEPGEKEVLKYLSSIAIEDDLDNPDYFKVHFNFEANPFFENRVLTKQFSEEGSASTTIKWKGKNAFPMAQEHDVWEYDELGLEQKGFFRWFCDPEEQFCDPVADILRCHIWYDPLEFYYEELYDSNRNAKKFFQR